tara:strand:+ start:1605 stop:2024 length:420 start_codon:yes stop_codon:yes gene_type:complete
MFFQKEIRLPKYHRGFHLITDYIINDFDQIKSVPIGLLHIFIKHTSASITINENSDLSVRKDLESYFNKYVPENERYYTHISEGNDDMPAHIKSSLLGQNLTIPVSNGQLNLGTWQGVYLCEHRDSATRRELVLTLIGL